MAKVTPVLRKHKANADGLFPVWIRVADRYRTLYHSLGEAIAASHWNPAAKRVRKSHPVADDLNALIQDRLAVAQAERVRLKRAGEPITAEAIKAALVGVGPDAVSSDYLVFADRHVQALRARVQIREFRREQTVVTKLRGFTKGPLPFESAERRGLNDIALPCVVISAQRSQNNAERARSARAAEYVEKEDVDGLVRTLLRVAALSGRSRRVLTTSGTARRRDLL